MEVDEVQAIEDVPQENTEIVIAEKLPSKLELQLVDLQKQMEGALLTEDFERCKSLKDEMAQCKLSIAKEQAMQEVNAGKIKDLEGQILRLNLLLTEAKGREDWEHCHELVLERAAIQKELEAVMIGDLDVLFVSSGSTMSAPATAQKLAPIFSKRSNMVNNEVLKQGSIFSTHVAPADDVPTAVSMGRILQNNVEEVMEAAMKIHDTLGHKLSRQRVGATEAGTSVVLSAKKACPVPNQQILQQRLDMLRRHHSKFYSVYCDPKYFTLTRSDGIYCTACKKHYTDMSSFFRYNIDEKTGKESTVYARSHYLSKGHEYCVDVQARSNQRQPQMVELLGNVTPTVPINIRVFRHDLVQFALAGKMSLDFLDTQLATTFFGTHVGPHHLTHSSNLRKEYIKILVVESEKKIKDILRGRKFSVISDGTTRVGDWMVFVFRCVNDDGSIEQLVILRRYTKHLVEVRDNAAEFSSTMIAVCTGASGQDISEIGLSNLVAFMADRIQINRTTMMGPIIRMTCRYSIFVDCHPHTLDNSACQMDDKCAFLHEFWGLHNGVFSRSSKAKDVFSQHTGFRIEEHNNTRWFGEIDAKIIIRDRWELYCEFFDTPEYAAADSSSQFYKLRKLLRPAHWGLGGSVEYQEAALKYFHVRLELALSTEGSMPYYVTCYRLEGDGPFAAFTFEEIARLRATLQYHTIESYPLTNAIVESKVAELPVDAMLAERKAYRDELNSFVFERMDMAKTYFENHFIRVPVPGPAANINCFGHLQHMWESMALINPDYIHRKREAYHEDNFGFTQLVSEHLQSLVTLNRIDQELKAHLMQSLGLYMRVAIQVNWSNLDFPHKQKALLEFWIVNRSNLKYWFEFACICYLHQPSSAAAERVFSVLKQVLTTEKEACLDDYVLAAVYARYSMRR